MATFNMSHSEVLRSSFLEVMRMIEEYNDMNSINKDDKDKDKGKNNGYSDRDWQGLNQIPGVSVKVE